MGATHSQNCVVVVGGGIAGLATALRLAPLPVILLAASSLGRGASTSLAQGGIAAALGPDDDPSLHATDTLGAGAGLSDPDVAAKVAMAAPACIEWLVAQGAAFDRTTSGDNLLLGLEAAHSRRRIIHAGGDRTGKHILDALIRAARNAPWIEIREGYWVRGLVLDTNGHVAGVSCSVRGCAGKDESILIPSRAVVMATGGIGGLYAHTTNPLSAIGGGLALAAYAGAVLRDLEFVQFHPTAMVVGLDPMPLATEALRGEGARLINSCGERFMKDIPGAELASRDVVARSIFAQISAGKRVYLDTRQALGEGIIRKFPGVVGSCHAAHIDPVRDPIPVRPAAHYHMGGIKVDGRGRSSVEGLWACGEVASTGLHGANRLASNSLLEALAYGAWIADDIRGQMFHPSTGQLPSAPAVLHPHKAGDQPSRHFTRVRILMDRQIGVIRDEIGLLEGICCLRALFRKAPSSVERDAAVVCLMIAVSAYLRQESRGAHQRIDYPGQMPEQHTTVTLDQTLRIADETYRPARARRVA